MIKKNSLSPLYALAACFIIPVIIACLLFFSGYQRTANRGILLANPITLTSAHTSTLPTWKILALASADSYSGRSNHIAAVTQRWQALGQDQAMLSLWQVENSQNQIPPPWQSMAISVETQNTIHSLNPESPCQYLILNPKNQAILCYSKNSSPADIHYDIRRLLKHFPIVKN